MGEQNKSEQPITKNIGHTNYELNNSVQLIVKDITKDKSKVVFKWFMQEVKIECDNLKMGNYNEHGELVNIDSISMEESYNNLFTKMTEIMNQIFKIEYLDLTLFTVIDLCIEHINICEIDDFGFIEDIEIKDLDFKINKYDPIQHKLQELTKQDTFLDHLGARR